MSLDRQFSRREVIAQARTLLDAGFSQKHAAGDLGVSEPTLSRWLGAYERGGTAELKPRYQGRCGRKKLAAGAQETDRLALVKLRLACGSDRLALDLWAHDERCTPALRAAILRPRASKHNLPASLRQLCYATPEIEAKFRGGKAAQLEGFKSRRDETIVLPDGSARAIAPGDVWEFDDMSNNQPFWWELAASADSPEARDNVLAAKQGAAIGRQVLFAQDVATGRWLGFELIGRPRDAYRAADILRFMRRLFEAHGLPRVGVRLERGIWKSKVIAGVNLPGDCRPDMDEAERVAIFGGLQELGLSVDWCYSPNHKGGIEGGFHHLQKVMAAQAVCAPEYVVDLGRKRGEFERGTKALLAAHAGRRHPRDLGFWHIDTARERLERACAFLNSAEEKEGRIQYGVPDVRWHEAVRAHPLRSLAKDKLWIFLPHESELVLRGGHVWGGRDGITHGFCAPTLFATLGSGYPLRVRFDASEPSLGAWIFNNCPVEDRRNVARHPLGAFLGWAEYSPDAPQFDAQHGFNDGGMRKRFNARVRASFAALGLFGKRAAAAGEVRDGAGAVSRVERAPRSDNEDSRTVGPSNRLTERAQPAPAAEPEDIDALERKLRERGALIG